MNDDAAVDRKDPDALSLLGLFLVIAASNALILYEALRYGA